ncbi:cupin domain-containing protein [Nocardioides mangrovicus]|uniref:Cupin domain-containing protein n=1 Tax=Nocardioides mangrovicus TaxID=2478913 RepID=A0A3L8P2C4_9ACTN|nr:pirin family protein [Nocardioides mangrovicus]RLV49102.1 cupin domain-containing protein [Nocardioides mangrovicus]
MGRSLEVRRAADCFVTTTEDGVHTRHAFSFGTHFDPAHTGLGPLVAHNQELLPPGTGYDAHAHAGLDIVSWVVEGELTHTDSTGHRAVTPAGRLQLLRAGSGVEHAERNEGDRPLRFVQMWLVADDPAAAPAYAQPDGPTLQVSSRARLHVARGEKGHTFRLPEADYVHVSVVRGSLDHSAGPLGPGDTARVRGEQDGAVLLTALEPSEILVWEMEE